MRKVGKGAILAEMLCESNENGNFLGFAYSSEYYRQHLDPERYSLAEKAYEKLIKVRPHYLGLLPLLLKEQYDTQVAMNLLHTTANTPPEEIPEIDKVLPYTDYGLHMDFIPVVIEVMGTPEIGKTELIQNAQNSWRDPLFVHIEVAQFAKQERSKKVEEGIGLTINDFIELRKRLLNSRLYEIIDDMRKDKIPNTPIVADRWLTDAQIIGKALFLHGELAAMDEFADPIRTLEEITSVEPIDYYAPDYSLENREDVNYAIMLCLATPKTSLLRAGEPEGDRSIVNKPFLSTLYEQYLRFHLQMVAYPRSFIYAALDLESEDQNANQQKFNNAVNLICNHYRRPFIK